MENQTTIRVYYDEDVTRDEDEIREELLNDLMFVDGITDVQIEQVYSGVPYEAIVTLDYDPETTDDKSILYDVESTFDYIHNTLNRDSI